MTAKRNSVTLKDIAHETGFSVNTVSRALRGKDDISLATRELIRQAAERMGHVNNALAASLRLGYTNTIAVIVGDISNPHFAIMTKEIEAQAEKYGYATILLHTNEDEAQERRALQTALNKNVDGILWCPVQKTGENLTYLQQSGVPFVLFGRREETCSYVVCNDEMGGYQATKALLEAGHREILLLHGALYISSARERLAGYRRAYQEAGLPVPEGLICEVPVKAEGCERVIGRLEKEGRSYTAIFAFSDMLAWEAWACLQRRGKKVPEDCSLIGFDHIQSRLTLPFTMTSVSSYKGRMSTEAVDMLLRQIRGEEGDRQLVIDTALADGGTVCPVVTAQSSLKHLLFEA